MVLNNLCKIELKRKYFLDIIDKIIHTFSSEFLVKALSRGNIFNNKGEHLRKKIMDFDFDENLPAH